MTITEQCVHHWMIDDNHFGVCKKCGAGKKFLSPKELFDNLDKYFTDDLNSRKQRNKQTRKQVPKTCPVCGKACGNAAGLSHHARSTHKGHIHPKTGEFIPDGNEDQDNKSTITDEFTCPVCGRGCRNRAGLVSHASFAHHGQIDLSGNFIPFPER